MEYRVRHHDGDYHWIMDIGVPRFNQDGSFAGYVGIALDVTERKKTEDAQLGMNRKLVEAQEKERTRIGRELHDDINQRLAFLAIQLEALKENPSGLKKRLTELWHCTNEIAADVQSLSHELHSAKLEYLGVQAGMRSLCREFAERHKIKIEFSSDVSSALSPEIGVTLFRVLQEALHNAVKHSGVNFIFVQFQELSHQIHLIVRDSGKGFDVEAALQGKGLGLTSMRERVRLVNGSIVIDSKPSGGTCIHVYVPLQLEHDPQRAAV
jgi:signal transduction histidine kinase